MLNLKAMFAGRREVIEVAPKRGPGRPPKMREAAAEEQDAAFEAVQQQAQQAEAFEAEILAPPIKKRSGEAMALAVALGRPVSHLRMPGAEAIRKHEGPQVRLALIEWMDKIHEDMGGGDEAWNLILRAAADEWNIPVPEVVRIYEARTKWQQQCEDRGVNALGMRSDQAHLPRYLRKSVRGAGVIARARGGGRKDHLEFLYPVVRDYLETLRLHGKYVDAQDLEDHLMHTMGLYLAEVDKPNNEAQVARAKVVREELARLKDPLTKNGVHKNRQERLMRFCEVRLRRPQRLVHLTIFEERMRWEATLQAYDRLLWQAMRPELLGDMVVKPEEFVEGIEDLVVCHCDQVPMWLRSGSHMQLYLSSEVKRRKAHAERPVGLSEAGGQVQQNFQEDGMAQMRQVGKSEGDRFRVTLELSQMVRHVFKPGVPPEVKHGRPVLVVPGAHARLSNIGEDGCFIEDEIFEVKGKQRVRKKGVSAGNLMLQWRKMKYSGSEEVKAWFRDIEVMQQPAAFCDGVIVSWIAEMRKNEGYASMIVMRDMFAGGLSQSCVRMSVLTSQLRAYIAGKMTPVMQLTDVGVAFNLKKKVEAVKAEIRRAKRGGVGIEAAVQDHRKTETSCNSEDLMRILAEAWKRQLHDDEVEDPHRLLRQTRACGWLSYRADPVRKCLVRCDEEDWMRGREKELPEETHRHPAVWWEGRYQWRNEDGEPKQPEWNKCGHNVYGLEYMRDEFPEGKPDEETTLHCLIGKQKVRLHCVDLSGEDEEMTFAEVGANVISDQLLRTQREKYEVARLKVVASEGKSLRRRGRRVQKVSAEMRRRKVKRQLARKARRQQLRTFIDEVRVRDAEGYSSRQLMRSHIPDIGTEVKISRAEVSEALSKKVIHPYIHISIHPHSPYIHTSIPYGCMDVWMCG